MTQAKGIALLTNVLGLFFQLSGYRRRHPFNTSLQRRIASVTAETVDEGHHEAISLITTLE